MNEFAIEIAGMPAEVHCRCPENQTFFREYFTGKDPLFTIAPTEDDLRRMQQNFDRMDAQDGLRPHERSESFLENNAIHELMAEKLVDYDVLLMHGSALCMDGEAIIFTAKSGTGKSTHARLWRERFGDRVWMINDDKPMLSIEENDITVWGTPWDGKHHLSRNASAPLKTIVSLTRDERNWIEPMSKADAFPVLMKQTFASKDPALMCRIMELQKHLLNAVDFYKLGCNMEPEAAETAAKVILEHRVQESAAAKPAKMTVL